MDQWHAHCSLSPLAARLIVFIFFIGLSCSLVQAESLLNALSLFAALTSSWLFMVVKAMTGYLACKLGYLFILSLKFSI